MGRNGSIHSYSLTRQDVRILRGVLGVAISEYDAVLNQTAVTQGNAAQVLLAKERMATLRVMLGASSLTEYRRHDDGTRYVRLDDVVAGMKRDLMENPVGMLGLAATVMRTFAEQRPGQNGTRIKYPGGKVQFEKVFQLADRLRRYTNSAGAQLERRVPANA